MTDRGASRDGSESTTETEDAEMTKDDAVRGILKGAGVVYAGLILNMAIAFVAQRFAAVYLSVGGFGSLLSGTALLQVGAVIAGLGISSGLTRYLPRIESEQQRPLVKHAFRIVVPFSLVVSVPTVLFAEAIATQVFDEPEIAVSLRIFGAVIPFAAIMNLAIGGVRGQLVSRFRVYIKDILHPSIRFGLIMIAVVVGAGQAGFALGYAIPFVVGSIVAVALLWRTLPTKGDSESAQTVLPEMIRYSLPFTISGLADFVYSSIDVFLLLYFIDSRAVGLYGVAYAFSQLIGMFSTAFSYLSSPISSQLESSGKIDEAVNVQKTIARWVTIATIAALVPMIIFASEFLGLIYRTAYETAGFTLVILVVGFGLKGVLLTHGPILSALGKSKVVAFNTTVSAIVNVVLNITLIPTYGIEGAAIATTVSFVVLGVLPTVEVWYYTSSTTLSRGVVAPIVVAVPVAVVTVPILTAVPKSLLWLLTVSAAFAAVYIAAVIVTLGFTREDVMVIRSIEDNYGIPLGPFDAVLRRFS